jgi:hypothetical protein
MLDEVGSILAVRRHFAEQLFPHARSPPSTSGFLRIAAFEPLAVFCGYRCIDFALSPRGEVLVYPPSDAPILAIGSLRRVPPSLSGPIAAFFAGGHGRRRTIVLVS